MKKAAIWAAVSSLPQAKKVSLDDQLTAGRAHAARHSATVISELVVPGESRDIVLFEDAARKIDAYRKLKELIDNRSMDVLIYYDTSRLGRTASLSMTVTELCSRAGILLYEIMDPPASLAVDPAEHNHLLMNAIKGVESQREIEKLKDRNKRGMLGKVEKGHFAYRINWGYETRYDNRGRVAEYVVNEEVADTLRMLANYYLGGMSLEQVANELNKLGRPSPTPGEWNKMRVSNIIDHAWRYAGYAEINSRSKTGRPYLRVKGLFPAILTEETVRSILQERDQRWGASKTLVGTHRYSLAIYCADCGKRMVAINTYRSPNRTLRERFQCREHGTTSARKIHGVVTDFITHLENKAFRENLIESSDESAGEDVQSQIEIHEAQIEKLRRGIADADADYYLGTLPADRYRTIVSTAQRRIEDIGAAITQLEDVLHQQRASQRRVDKIEEIRRHGLEYINDPDVKKANVWIRHHLRIWIRNTDVILVEIVS